jgi:hypothetical protein
METFLWVSCSRAFDSKAPCVAWSTSSELIARDGEKVWRLAATSTIVGIVIEIVPAGRFDLCHRLFSQAGHPDV